MSIVAAGLEVDKGASAAPKAQLGHGAAAPQRRAATRQGGIRHEIMVQIEWLVAVSRNSLVAAVGPQPPTLLVVEKVRDHHLVEHLGVDRRVLDRQHELD